MTDLGVRAVAQKDLPEYQYTHFHPSDTAGVLLSLDTTFAPKGVDPALWWPPAEKDWLKHARSDVTNGLAGVEIQHPDPAAAAANWSKILDRPLRGQHIRLDGVARSASWPIATAAGQGVSAYDVKAVDKAKVLAAAEKRGKKRGTVSGRGLRLPHQPGVKPARAREEKQQDDEVQHVEGHAGAERRQVAAEPIEQQAGAPAADRHAHRAAEEHGRNAPVGLLEGIVFADDDHIGRHQSRQSEAEGRGDEEQGKASPGSAESRSTP